ncbi:MAG: HAD family hydrolase, partial [Spirochaetales bacterium]|nr:HAD family hydrolase [Spirochaetales bacterium]
YYESHYATYSRAYPGIVELLVKLKEKGYGLGVISNKTETLVKLIVNELFPDNLFSYIGGGCDKIALKPDEAPLDKALTTLSINKDDVLYFGDSEVDNQFIENCKIKGGIVTWGFRSRSLLEEKNIKPLIYDVSQLEEFIYGSN